MKQAVLSQNCQNVHLPILRAILIVLEASIPFENLSEGIIATYLWDFGERRET